MLTEEEWEEQERKDPEQGIGHSRELYTVWSEKTNMLLGPIRRAVLQS